MTSRASWASLALFAACGCSGGVSQPIDAAGGGSDAEAISDALTGPDARVFAELPIEWTKPVYAAEWPAMRVVGGFDRLALVLLGDRKLVYLDAEGQIAAEAATPSVFPPPSLSLPHWAAIDAAHRLYLCQLPEFQGPVTVSVLDASLQLVGGGPSGCDARSFAYARAGDKVWVVGEGYTAQIEPQEELCAVAAAESAGPIVVESGSSYSHDPYALAVVGGGRLVACVSRSHSSMETALGSHAGEILVIDPLAAGGAGVVDRYSLGVNWVGGSCQLVPTTAGIVAVWGRYVGTTGMQGPVSAALLSSIDGSLVKGPLPLGDFFTPPQRWIHHEGHIYGASPGRDKQPFLVRVDAAELVAEQPFGLAWPAAGEIISIDAVSNDTDLFIVSLQNSGGGSRIVLSKVSDFAE